MLYYEGLTCPVCHKRFENGEDIVACPQCGLPHHRSCWQVENHCHMESDHGTEREWSREKATAEATKGHIPPEGQPKNAQVCPRCYTKNAEFAEFCAHCGRQLTATEWHSVSSTPVNQYVPFPTSDRSQSGTINGISEKDLSAVVGVNTQYYIPRFYRIKSGYTSSWNLSAFLFGPLWLLYRKQYALGGLMFAFQMVLDFASMWLMHPINAAQTEADMLVAMEQMMRNPMMLPAMLLSFLLLAAHILLGIKGNHLYLHHCCKRIHSVREETPDLSSGELSSFGGVSVGAAALFYLLSTLLANGFAAWLLM